MTSLLDDMGRALFKAFGLMMPRPKAWRASQQLSEISRQLTEIAAAMEEDTRGFENMGHVSAAVDRILGASKKKFVQDTKKHTNDAARMAVTARELVLELTAMAQRLQEITTGYGNSKGYSLPGLLQGYMEIRVKATKAAASYLESIGATRWAQSLRNISN